MPSVRQIRDTRDPPRRHVLVAIAVPVDGMVDLIVERELLEDVDLRAVDGALAKVPLARVVEPEGRPVPHLSLIHI